MIVKVKTFDKIEHWIFSYILRNCTDSVKILLSIKGVQNPVNVTKGWHSM